MPGGSESVATDATVHVDQNACLREWHGRTLGISQTMQAALHCREPLAYDPRNNCLRSEWPKPSPCHVATQPNTNWGAQFCDSRMGNSGQCHCPAHGVIQSTVSLYLKPEPSSLCPCQAPALGPRSNGLCSLPVTTWPLHAIMFIVLWFVLLGKCFWTSFSKIFHQLTWVLWCQSVRKSKRVQAPGALGWRKLHMAPTKCATPWDTMTLCLITEPERFCCIRLAGLHLRWGNRCGLKAPAGSYLQFSQVFRIFP